MANYDYNKSYIEVEREMNELTGFIEEICLLNLDEATMELSCGIIPDEKKIIISNQRSDYMEKCIKSLNKLKNLIGGLK
jgi:hypothetical protein